MKRITALFLAAAFICCMLAACTPGSTDETASPADTTLPKVEITETIPVESLPDPGNHPEITPSLPIETIPEKPEADYSLPPGEEPGSNPVNK